MRIGFYIKSKTTLKKQIDSYGDEYDYHDNDYAGVVLLEPQGELRMSIGGADKSAGRKLVIAALKKWLSK